MTETSQASNALAEPAVPEPPRFWWLKRLALGAVVVGLMLAGVRLWWGREAQRRLDGAIDELRARGQPVLRDEFRGADIPNAENAAVYLQSAVAAINPNDNPPSATNTVYGDYPPFPRRWHRSVDQAVSANAKALELARQARQAPRVEWNLPIARPAIATALPTLSRMRHLANLLGDAALHAHLKGNDAEAIERCRDLLGLSRALEHQPFLVSFLVAIGIESLALHRIEVIASDLRIARDETDAATTSPSAPAAQRAQVQALIRDLIDRDDPAGVVRAIQSERMMTLDGIDWMTDGNPLLEPLFKFDQLRMIQHMDHSLRAATQPSWPEAQAVLAEQPGMVPGARAGAGSDVRIASIISSLLTPGINRVINIELRVRMDRRLATAALALRLYYADHGRWPQSLEALVPAYLPAVPMDPCVEDQPIKFVLIPNALPDGAPRPVVYSVGEDGRDDTAAGAVPTPEPRFGYNAKDPDQWRDLVRFLPPAPTAEPSDEGTDAADPIDDEDEDEDEDEEPATSTTQPGM